MFLDVGKHLKESNLRMTIGVTKGVIRTCVINLKHTRIVQKVLCQATFLNLFVPAIRAIFVVSKCYTSPSILKDMIKEKCVNS